MKNWIISAAAALILIAGVWAQDNPGASSDTVAKPRKQPAADSTGTTSNSDSNLAPIPSKLSPKATKGNEAESDASFKAETNVVNVDVQVLDNHGNPIPNIPRDKFRILEDNVPQTMTQYSVGASADDCRDGDRVQRALPGVLQQRLGARR